MKSNLPNLNLIHKQNYKGARYLYSLTHHIYEVKAKLGEPPANLRIHVPEYLCIRS